MICLVDTSVWIDFFSDVKASHVETLDVLLDENQDICICGLILTEILQGIRREKEYSKTKEYLKALVYLPMAQKTFVKAADIYRTLRKKGITIRKPIDCMIGALALEHDVHLLHNDKDFDLLKKHFGLKVVR